MVLPLAIVSVDDRVKPLSIGCFCMCGVVVMFWNLYKPAAGPWLATIASLAVLLLGANRKVRKQLLVVGVLASLVLLVRPGVTDTIWNTYLRR